MAGRWRARKWLLVTGAVSGGWVVRSAISGIYFLVGGYVQITRRSQTPIDWEQRRMLREAVVEGLDMAVAFNGTRVREAGNTATPDSDQPERPREPDRSV